MLIIADANYVTWYVTDKSFGRYKRIFSIGTLGISTYHPNTLEVTNKWVYADIKSITATNVNNEFKINGKRDRKIETMTFSTEHRAILMTEALRYRHQFSDKPKEILVCV